MGCGRFSTLRERLITFDIIPLVPYPGFAQLM
jgi:hypothetical protein